jgi:hypothetical protein
VLASPLRLVDDVLIIGPLYFCCLGERFTIFDFHQSCLQIARNKTRLSNLFLTVCAPVALSGAGPVSCGLTTAVFNAIGQTTSSRYRTNSDTETAVSPITAIAALGITKDCTSGGHSKTAVCQSVRPIVMDWSLLVECHPLKAKSRPF